MDDLDRISDISSCMSSMPDLSTFSFGSPSGFLVPDCCTQTTHPGNSARRVVFAVSKSSFMILTRDCCCVEVGRPDYGVRGPCRIYEAAA